MNNIKSLLNNGEMFNSDLGNFDRVLCDLPCSGLGIMVKKPEIRYKNVALLDNLPDLQYHLLCTSCEYVKSGGMLIYSTCTLRKCENEQIVEKFLNEHSDFSIVRVLPEIERNEDTLTLFPHQSGTDGFFISAFIRE